MWLIPDTPQTERCQSVELQGYDRMPEQQSIVWMVCALVLVVHPTKCGRWTLHPCLQPEVRTVTHLSTC